jgi:hypothetical protein
MFTCSPPGDVEHEFVMEAVPEAEISVRDPQADAWFSWYVVLLQAGPMVISRSLPKETTAGPVHVLADPETLDACTPDDEWVALDVETSPGISSSITFIWAGVVSASDFLVRSMEGGGLVCVVVCAGGAAGADVADAGVADIGMLLSKSSIMTMLFMGRERARLLDMSTSVRIG